MVSRTTTILIGSIAVLLVSAAAFLAGSNLGGQRGARDMETLDRRPTPDTTPTSTSPVPIHVRGSFLVFWDVWNLVEEEFYRTEPLDKRQMMYGAIAGMMLPLEDEATRFLPPGVAAPPPPGTFEGIGIGINLDDQALKISRIFPDSPAEAAGLQADDIIVQIDDQEVAPLIGDRDNDEILQDVSNRIGGPLSSTVRLVIERPPAPDPINVEVMRAIVPLPSVAWHMLDDDIAYIKVALFNQATPDHFTVAMREIADEEPAGIVLDLRNNPGGPLEPARRLLGHFYQGTALSQKDNHDTFQEIATIRTANAPTLPDTPLVVLINEHTASSAEVVAGALHERYPNTIVLGTESAGQGTAQQQHTFPDGSRLTMTTGHWFTPEKERIHAIGIAPTHPVEESSDDEYTMPCVRSMLASNEQQTCADAPLWWAIQFLTDGDIPPTPQPTPTP